MIKANNAIKRFNSLQVRGSLREREILWEHRIFYFFFFFFAFSKLFFATAES